MEAEIDKLRSALNHLIDIIEDVTMNNFSGWKVLYDEEGGRALISQKLLEEYKNL